MDAEQVRTIASLEARCHVCHAIMCSMRDLLIEALGDFLCGSGYGPSVEALWAFEEAEFLEALARLELTVYKAAIKTQGL
ncbi:MAG: hypothetical protein EOP14_03510 [Pseudomonas sp.]|nr:MAG: hypothetical protein EOP14_03510 [Pseudomonas sp.]